MKDPADHKTVEMEYETPVYGRAVTVPATQYRVYITTTDGIHIVWTHLTRKQAFALHKLNSKNINVLQSSTEVQRFGWEEM